jgi:hypothetical protein
VRARSGTDTLVPGACAVDTHREVGVTDAILVDARGVAGRDVPVAAHDIVDVVAQAGGAGTDASTNAELVIRDEASPVVVLKTSSERVSVHKSANWVAISIGASVIQFTSLISTRDVHLGEITDAGNLNIFRGLDKVNAFQGAVGNGSRAATRLGAPSNLNALSVTNASGVRWSPQTEITGGVDP